MIGRLLLLIGGAAAFWLLAGLPARAFGGGDRALVFCGAAVLLCLPPMAVSLLWAGWAQRQSPQDQLVAVAGGTGVRMLFVLSGALVLALAVPYFQHQVAFWVWVLVVYMACLVLDVALILAGRPSEGVRGQGPGVRKAKAEPSALTTRAVPLTPDP